MKFNELNLAKPLLSAIKEVGYEIPSPIQEKAIPPVLAGRDLLGCAQTGTGKTAAFALPVLQTLVNNEPKKKNAIRALIVTPTRELALQIQQNIELYGKYTKVRSTVIFGGVNQGPQVAKLKEGIDILVATPGRLNDLINQGYISLSNIEIFVLDEADRMLDMGFIQDVRKILKLLPSKRQTLLFSATMPAEIVSLANSLLNNPAKVFVTPAATTVERIEQRLYKVDKPNKRHLLAELLRSSKVDSALVFTRTKHGADRVVRELSRAGIHAAAIHGNKSQNARQNALENLKSGKIQVLVATDIAARGLDINELSHVFNYDLPNIPETYVHRIGRTGRAGHGGIAISFATADELPYLADIERLIGFSVPEVQEHQWKGQTTEKATVRQAVPKPTKPASKTTKSIKASSIVLRENPKTKPEQGNNRKMKNTNKTDNRKTNDVKQAAPDATKDKPKKNFKKPDGRKNDARKQRQPSGKPAANSKRAPIDPYENLTGGKAIITKKPVWGESATTSDSSNKGDSAMNRNNKRRGSGKGRGKPAEAKNALKPKKTEKLPEIPKNEHGVFDFSEEELAEDKGIKVISRGTGEVKYANFEDYLKNQ